MRRLWDNTIKKINEKRINMNNMDLSYREMALKTKLPFSLSIMEDSYPENPRKSFDNAFSLFILGKYQFWGDDWHESCSMLKKATNIQEAEDIIRENFNVVIMLPVYVYQHSGTLVSTERFACLWDSGQIGFTFATREQVKEIRPDWKLLTKSRKEEIKSMLLSEFDMFKKYIEGDVYGFVITDQDGVEIDDCWGFFGQELAKEEGESQLKILTEYTEKVQNEINQNKTEQAQGDQDQ
jgi:hypothetical protein